MSLCGTNPGLIIAPSLSVCSLQRQKDPENLAVFSKWKKLGKNAQCRENAVVLCRSTIWVLSFTFWWPCYFRRGSGNIKEQIHPLYYGPSQHRALNNPLTWRQTSSRCGWLWIKSSAGAFLHPLWLWKGHEKILLRGRKMACRRED